MNTNSRRPSRPHRRAFGQDQVGVSEIVGSVLLIALTVSMAGGLAALVFSFDGPLLVARANLSITLDPGANGWNAADESIVAKHLGGDRLEPNSTRITFIVNGLSTTLAGSSLASAFSDGAFTVGETWSKTVPLNSTDAVTANVVGGGQGSILLSSVALRPSELGSGPGCVLDNVGPSVSTWVQAPPNVLTTTSGAISITAVASDACYGVDNATLPILWYCLNVDCSIPGNFVSAGATSLTGANQFSGTIPAQVWGLQGGKTLKYELRGLTDLGGKVSTATAPADVVDIITTYTYVFSNTDVLGTTTPGTFPNAQTAGDGGAEAAFVEAKVATSALTVGSATCIVSCTPNPPTTRVQNSDNSRVTLASINNGIDATGFTVPGGATQIVKVVIGMEISRESGTQTAVLSYKVGGVTGPSSQSNSTSSTTDSVHTLDVSADRAWTMADINTNNLHVLVTRTSGGGADLYVDHIFATVTYALATGTQNSLEERLVWSSVPSGSLQTLELSYRVSPAPAAGDTFRVQLWNGASWRTCAGVLNAGTSFTCPLVLPAEYNGGAPEVRITDVTPTSTTQTTLFVGYARIATV